MPGFIIYGTNGQTELRNKISSGSVAEVIHNIYGNDLVGTCTVTSTSSEKNYFLKDHLGSIKVIVNADGSISSYTDYDPFGLELIGRSNSDERYKFTGKERDTETSYDYFGARYYDSRIARWLQVDPMFEKYPAFSTYNYCMNNPLKMFDPNGKWAYLALSKNGIQQRFTAYKKDYPNAKFISSVSSAVEKELKRLPDSWKNDAPAVAKFFAEKQIPITFMEGMDNGKNAMSDNGVNGIIFNSNLSNTDNMGFLKGREFHEIIHLMSPNNDEFQALAAESYMGYQSDQGILDLINEPSGYFNSGMPDDIKEKYFDSNNNLKEGEVDNFLKWFKDYGGQIVHETSN